ncbi:MAG: leucine-rich repeat domain-containing protein [Lachnospiraceae bacterium]|nr:leucine-rich repeat domain-containing protein [Lachnospiraceae bacterium]
MKKAKILLLPAAAVGLTLAIGGIYLAHASSAADFNTVKGVLYSYNGSDASVVIPEGVKEIHKDAFRDNVFLEQVSIPSTVETIGPGAFEGCSALRSVTIPDSVEVLEDAAFMGCSSLRSVNIGSGVREMGNGVFGDCDSLSYINVSSSNQNLIANGHALYNAGMTKLYQYCAGSPSGAYTVPGNVEKICPNAFWGCDELKVVTIPGIPEISEYAFADCKGLMSVTMQVPTNRIALKAFSGCSNLVQAIVPDSVRDIHETAFDGCPADLHIVCSTTCEAADFAEKHEYLTSETPVYTIRIEEDETEALRAEYQAALMNGDEGDAYGNEAGISYDADGTQAAETYTDASGEQHDGLRVTYDGVVLGNAPVVSDRAYIMVDNFQVVDASQSAAPTPTETQKAADDGKLISDHAHYLDLTLTEFTFPKTLKMIGDFAFARSGIVSADLPEGLTYIGEGAFYHCDSLSEVTIPSTVTSIGKNAFNYTPWYQAWENNANASDFLIVGDGVLIGYKGRERTPALPAGVKHVADGVFE